MSFHFMKFASLATAGLIAATFASPAAEARTTRERAACSVTIETVNVAVIGGGGGGSGVLHCKGKAYPFSIGGAGLGSLGISKMNATGSVYRLAKMSDFEGVYGQVRAGATAGNKGSDVMTLQNDHGVVMRLTAHSKGLAVTAGGDALVVKFK